MSEISPQATPETGDPHFKIFHELMAYKVREILLVSSPYDAYIMEEDVSLASRIINEYHGLNLSHPPRLTRVETAEEALEILHEKQFDMVITMPHLGSMDCISFGRQVKKINRNIKLVLLAHSVQDIPMRDYNGGNDCIDREFIWCCDSDILLAIVKNIEDQMNVDADTSRAMVRIILLVEDSPQHRSLLLPLLYKELVQQTQAVLAEGLNEQHRLLKMRARPKILTAENYEQAFALFNRYRRYIFAVMSDVRFPKMGRLHKQAGQELLRKIRRMVPDLPLLMLSTDPANKQLAETVPAVFVDKLSDELEDQLHDFFLRYLGFGEFVFRMPDGREVARAASLSQFETAIRQVPVESLMYHAGHNHFSHWVMARAEIALAARLDQHRFTGITSGEALREDLVTKVHALRKLRQQGVVTQFSPEDFDPQITDFVRIGRGSMGGKARGLAFIFSRLEEIGSQQQASSRSRIRIPRTCVITADIFDEFVSANGLEANDGEPDSRIAERFLNATMPEKLLHDLRRYLQRIDYPFSVRSSSMLEDAQFRPYAGLYKTYMLANNPQASFELRFSQLVQAIKLVYASTWFAAPRAFARTTGQTRHDSMAVIIQELSGRRYGRYFYPALSGVAQSYNYYPVAPMRPEDGIAHIALGFGKTVVEGETSLRFSPAHPGHLPQFSTVRDILDTSQRRFYSLDCSQDSPLVWEESNLVVREIDDAADEFPVRLLCSTFFPDDYRIRDVDLPGPKVLTFAPLLKYNLYPLADILAALLARGRKDFGCEVEIEFAVDLVEELEKSIFYFLQIRPIVTTSEQGQVRITPAERRAGVILSSRSLGHGVFATIRDVIYVHPERFERAATREISREIGQLNAMLHREGRPYLLIGPGRWGTADPWLGIPVQWNDISGVQAIVELIGSDVRAEPSQGSHFFQNITSLGIPYLMVPDREPGEDSRERDGIDWSWLLAVPPARTTQHVCHACLAEPLRLKVDGNSGEGVVLAADRVSS